MSAEAERRWPSARVGNVARLRAIAAARPHLAYRERVIDAPFDVVWSVFGDLENGVPQFDTYVRWLRIESREGERLTLRSNAPVIGPAMKFEAIYREGWCVMRSFEGEVGMAADALDAGRTRVAHVEGSRWLCALGRWWFMRTMARELETLARLCEARR
ncbi:MAG: hypothetical protein FJ091_20270 [Deltaproteobacteria bacterium]|nr:hypothetical protein [Deltaproteobacteria bacterium]